ncbi:GPW/gp25 family protein [Streptomyces sp. FIT100]|uniref:GPW/gp25 family protein n=1 Tax=Streptomyces sp. FIT100 TaxID=2837956 RepID=UPI0037DA235B
MDSQPTCDYEVRSALDRWEPRIVLEDVAVGAGDAQQGLLYVRLRYRIATTNSTRNLVFSFYLIPGEYAPHSGGRRWMSWKCRPR